MVDQNKDENDPKENKEQKLKLSKSMLENVEKLSLDELTNESDVEDS